MTSPALSRPEAGVRRVGRTAAGHLGRSLGLLVVLALTVPFLLAANRVTVAVDGTVVELRTYAETVEEVLAEVDVALGGADQIHPAPTSQVTDGLTIAIDRAIPVTVAADGRKHRLQVVADDIGDVLEIAGIEAPPGTQVTPPLHADVQARQRIDVVRPVTVTVSADGQTHAERLLPGRVADALGGAGISLGRDDRVYPPLSAALTDDMTIVVRRIGTAEEAEEVALPFQEQVVETEARFEGDRVVVQEGAEGLRIDTYRLRTVDGEVVVRELVHEEVVRDPRDRIVEVGTKPRPVAPREPTGSVWDDLARCESGGNWQARGAYHGGLQFHPDTWRRWRPAGYPEYAYEATREQQIEVGKRLQAARGWGAWGACARRLGLT